LKIICEILLAKSLGLSIGSFFEMSLYQDGKYVNRSFGSNNFHVNTVMNQDSRLCSLGRNSVIQLPFEDFPEKVQIQSPSTIFLENTTQLKLLCKTNIFLTMDNFMDYIYLKCTFDDKEFYFDTKDYSNDITHVNDGRFLINLSNILLKNT